ncbi:biotin carboxyl carrier protein of acetyl-CoA carboxylase, chloroplastic-like [Vicia villosa]|uniref:biotin carboxyl carrier protein of acetyl-CoA carboxylase, chloroplastic-like n=1 Tax=Vicia villosa TaxID=3911 RepID=UPI00273AD574|nr:biotin carboxyl carrier protein of acetyl-CoA carboxylase, chloroplastic-like [Vicia villosa]
MSSFTTIPCPKCLTFHHLGLSSQSLSGRNVQVGFKKCQSFGSVSCDLVTNGIQCLERKQTSVWKSQAHPNEAATIENSSNSAPALVNEPKDLALPKEEDNHNGKPSGPTTPTDEESSVFTFMNQVSELIKLVDSRDIVELELKQAGYELMIKKKEALQPPPVSQQSFSYPAYPSHYAPPPPPPSVATSAPASAPPAKPVAALLSKSSASSHPPFKCPMAGTFYRCPAPGAPPFVKVGDKVQKGQVICIIEAMKLMNEIEADQTGTIVEILVEDAKPVSVGLPLFAIAP